jgi:mannose/cellobiose epimerase-like protein (N-acyl-D-glucosamine 2-epimerase family)
MQDPDFPEELHRLIEAAIPTMEAAELLLLLHGHPGREWTAEQLQHAIRPTVMSGVDLDKALVLFAARGLVEVAPDRAVRYRPATSELESMVRALAKVYNQRPVTLVRTIYTLKIRSFADAFKIKKD